MSQFQFLSRLNSSERRILMFAGLFIFAIANWFAIWPHRSDLTNYRDRLRGANSEFDRRQTIIQEANRLAPDIARLLREGGGAVLPEDQALQLAKTINTEMTQSGVNLISNSRLITSTNDPFFAEQVQNYQVASGEKQLVDFLYRIGIGDSQIRVRALSVRPDTPRQALNANITLVANYRKDLKRAQAAATTATPRPTSPTTATTPKPTTAPTPKPTTAPGGPVTRTIPAPTPTTKQTSAPPVRPSPAPYPLPNRPSSTPK